METAKMIDNPFSDLHESGSERIVRERKSAAQQTRNNLLRLLLFSCICVGVGLGAGISPFLGDGTIRDAVILAGLGFGGAVLGAILGLFGSVQDQILIDYILGRQSRVSGYVFDLILDIVFFVTPILFGSSIVSALGHSDLAGQMAALGGGVPLLIGLYVRWRMARARWLSRIRSEQSTNE
jgi:hypothetical protein